MFVFTVYFYVLISYLNNSQYLTELKWLNRILTNSWDLYISCVSKPFLVTKSWFTWLHVITVSAPSSLSYVHEYSAIVAIARLVDGNYRYHNHLYTCYKLACGKYSQFFDCRNLRWTLFRKYTGVYLLNCGKANTKRGIVHNNKYFLNNLHISILIILPFYEG